MIRHTSKLLLAALVLVLSATAFAQELEKKVNVALVWKRKGADVFVTATLHNKSGKTLIDPIVRVTFFDKDGNEVATAAKAYFTRLGKGVKKRLETRIWSEIDTNAVRAEGTLDTSLFQ